MTRQSQCPTTVAARSYGFQAFRPRWLRLIVVAIVISVLVPLVPPLALAEEGCEFRLGFAALREALIRKEGRDVVGACLENEHHNAVNGDGLQRTTGGLLVWRKSDNWTAFTDGYRTWVNGPHGIERRLNIERFSWEKDPSVQGAPSLQCVSNPESAVKSRDVDVVRYDLFRTAWGATVMNVRVRNNCAEARRIEFRTRVYRDDSSPPLAVGRTYEDHFGPYEERGYLYGWADPNGAYPPIEPSHKVVFRWNWVKVGSDEPHCIDVGGSRCLIADPRLRSTIEDLASVPDGAELLKMAADFGVSMRRDTLPAGALAAYQPLTRVITVHTDLDDYGEFERAAVLAHELRHAVDHAQGKLGETVGECLLAEERAFAKQSEVWYKLWRDVLPRPGNALQLRLNQTAEATRYNPVWLSERVLQAYGESCE